jgi:hypothetical protein
MSFRENARVYQDSCMQAMLKLNLETDGNNEISVNLTDRNDN